MIMGFGFELDGQQPKTWAEAREMIRQKPELLWHENKFGKNLAHECVCRSGGDELAFMLERIRLESRDEEELLEKQKKFFEFEAHGMLPLHYVTDGLKTFKYLVEECCPTGFALLDRRDIVGWNFAHHAAFDENFEVFEYVLFHAPKGLALLEERDDLGRVPLPFGGPSFEEHFNERKLREIGLKRELSSFEKSRVDKPGTFANLVLDIVQQQSELLVNEK